MPNSQKEPNDSILPNEETNENTLKETEENKAAEEVPENAEAEATAEMEAEAETEAETEAQDAPDEMTDEAAQDTPNDGVEGEEAPQRPGVGVQTLSFVFDLTELFAISFAIVIVVLCFLLRHSPVSGSSMFPTIHDKDTLLVSDVGYTPEHGDIVIVQSLHNLEKPLVKRVIALGGDRIEINFDRWMIKVNGIIVEQRLDAEGNPAKIGGDYVNYKEGISMRLGSKDGSDLYKIGFTYDPITGNYLATVPEGRLFILGDNRNDSKDSRDATVGFVDQRLVIGKAVFRLTPFSQMGTLD